MKISPAELYDDLSNDEEIQALVKQLGNEWRNRNTSPAKGIAIYSGDVIPGDDSTLAYSRLINLVRKRQLAADFDDLSEIVGNDKYFNFSISIFNATHNGKPDPELLTRRIIVALISDHEPGIDEYIESMHDVTLLDELGISYDKEYLVKLNPGADLRSRALVLDDKKMIYPHQFLRRSYDENFVNTLSLLKKYLDNGIDVKLRIDPLRKSMSRYYREYVEADFWHGKHFSTDLLMSKDTQPTWTKHATDNFLPTKEKPLNPRYPVRFTIFRSKMMDINLREFMIEEYLPLSNPLESELKLPGFGKRYTIQKFGHMVYDQHQHAFIHFDTAVRVFAKEEYESIFNTIESGKDPGDKVGIRHKLYLIEGSFQLDLVEPLMYDFFMYNPHIEEYFFKNQPSLTP